MLVLPLLRMLAVARGSRRVPLVGWLCGSRIAGWRWRWRGDQRFFPRHHRFVGIVGHASEPPVVQPGLSRGRSPVRIHDLVVVDRLAWIVQFRQRSLGLTKPVGEPVGLIIGGGFGLRIGFRLLDKLQLLLESRQLVIRRRLLLLPVVVPLDVPLKLLDFFLDFLHRLGLDGSLVAFLHPFLLVALELLLASLSVMLLHRVRIPAALVTTSHDGGDCLLWRLRL